MEALLASGDEDEAVEYIPDVVGEPRRDVTVGLVIGLSPGRNVDQVAIAVRQRLLVEDIQMVVRPVKVVGRGA